MVGLCSLNVHWSINIHWMFVGRTDAEAETPLLWPADAKSWLIWKDHDAGKDWRREKKGTTEDEMVGWHHWLNGVWVNSGGWWWTGRPGVLQSMGLQTVGHLSDWTELMVGLMATSSKRAYASHRQVCCTQRTLSLWQTTANPCLHGRRSNTVLSQPLWGPWVLVCKRFVCVLWASPAGIGFDSKCEFAPPTILLGLLLCPWMWGISSQLL